MGRKRMMARPVEVHRQALRGELTLAELYALEDELVSGECEICGRKSKKLKLTSIYLWDYGERRLHKKYMCPRCRSALARGKL